MIQSFLAARNPLALPASSLPGPLLLMARLVVLVLLIRGYAIAYMPVRGVPFLAVLEAFGSDWGWRRGLVALFLSGAVMVFFNLLPRLGCLLVGASLIVGTAIDSAGYANSRLFPGCLLFLTALQDGSAPARFALRAQIFLLYVGATLSKLFEPDWWSGQYFEFWLREKLGLGWYGALADQFPPRSLSVFMGVATMIMELVIVVGLARRAWWPRAFACAVVFHVGAFVVSGLDFGVFLYVSILSFTVFAPDDLFARIAALPIATGARWFLAQPAAWFGAILALLFLGRVSLTAQKIAMMAVAAGVLWVIWHWVGTARRLAGAGR